MAWIPSAEDLLKAAQETVSDAVETSTEAVGEVAGGVQNAIDAATSAVSDAVGAAGDAVGNAAEDPIGAVTGSLEGGIEYVIATSADLLQHDLREDTQMVQTAADPIGIGLNVVGEVATGVVAGIGEAIGAVAGATDEAVGATVEAIEEHPATIAGAVIGGAIGGVAGPEGAVVGAAIGAEAGYLIDDPEAREAVEQAVDPGWLADGPAGIASAEIVGAEIGGAIGGLARPGGAVLGAAAGAGVAYVISNPDQVEALIDPPQDTAQIDVVSGRWDGGVEEQELAADEGSGPAAWPDPTQSLADSFGEGRADTPAGDAGSADDLGSTVLTDPGLADSGESGVGEMPTDDAALTSAPWKEHGQGRGLEKHAERRLDDAGDHDAGATVMGAIAPDTPDGLMDVSEDMSEDGLDQAAEIVDPEPDSDYGMTDA